ncbi:MAG: YeiH family putative sulfate export transporter [Rhodospirillaceae bacterium]|nr:YeiH family putative sulfate export transporter [Rhodospirillales bacterium]
MPGLGLAAGLTALAYGARAATGLDALSPLILAAGLGMAWRAVAGRSEQCRAGTLFASRWLMRLAIVLLGLRITVAQVIELGAASFAIIAVTLAATYTFTAWAGATLGVERRLSQLIACGTSICGASAVMASNSVVAGSDEDVAYAVACVTVFGSLSMFLYPLLPALLHLDPSAYGLWAGASIHEVAQVIAASFQAGPEAGEAGTIAKLGRVALLLPVVFALGWSELRRPNHATEARQKPPIPWFVLGFGAMIAVNSLGVVPVEVAGWGIQASGVLLSLALAALGLETHFGNLLARGWRPLALGAVAWIFVSAFSLGLVEAVY